MGAMFKDLKFGARALMRMPGPAVISVAVLALGIGLCSFMFSIVYGLYFRGFGCPEDDLVLVVWKMNVERNQTSRSLSIQDPADFRERQAPVQELLGYRSGTVNIEGNEAPVRYQGSFVTANTVNLLGVQPVIGRGLAVAEDAPGSTLDFRDMTLGRWTLGVQRAVGRCVPCPVEVDDPPAALAPHQRGDVDAAVAEL
jgi:putative ABC transport system permease protein